MYDPNEVLIARVNEILSEAAEEDERRRTEKKDAESAKVDRAQPRPRPTPAAEGKVVPLAPVTTETEEKAPARRRLA